MTTPFEISIEDFKALKPSSWESINHILRPDRLLLQDSLMKFGWIQPLTVRVANNSIIDGLSRWVLAAEHPETLGKEIPVHWIDCDEVDAMVLHIVLNRGRGNVLNRDLSQLIKRIRRTKKYEDEFLKQSLRMTDDEFDLLADGTLIKMRKVSRHTYSKAWVPVETRGALPTNISIERPPNKDE